MMEWMKLILTVKKLNSALRFYCDSNWSIPPTSMGYGTSKGRYNTTYNMLNNSLLPFGGRVNL